MTAAAFSVSAIEASPGRSRRKRPTNFTRQMLHVSSASAVAAPQNLVSPKQRGSHAIGNFFQALALGIEFIDHREVFLHGLRKYAFQI